MLLGVWLDCLHVGALVQRKNHLLAMLEIQGARPHRADQLREFEGRQEDGTPRAVADGKSDALPARSPSGTARKGAGPCGQSRAKVPRKQVRGGWSSGLLGG